MSSARGSERRDGGANLDETDVQEFTLCFLAGSVPREVICSKNLPF